MTLRVRTLGELELELDGAQLVPPTGRPARALLAWLALHPRTHARSAVAAALWPDVLDTSARASLRTALSAVRRALGPASGALRADRERVELSEDVVVDLREFDRLLDSGEPEAALELARGELLPDLDEDWVLRLRDRHRERCGVAFAAMAGAAADAECALAWARRRAELDPFDEAAHRELMTALAATGEVASALAVYERLRARMRRELGLVPSSASRDLAAALRAGEPQQGAQPPLPPRLRPERYRTPFVGRTAALAGLGAIRAALAGGGARFGVVVGEPGIGKSRLAARFAAELHAGGDTVIAGRSVREAGEPFLPLLEALGEAAPRLEESGGDARAGRQRLNDLLADALEYAAAGRPLLLVLDDLQWADGATLDFLRHLAGRHGSTPILVVATARPGSPIGALVEELEATQIDLAGLTVAETEALLAGRGEARSIEALVRRTGGNPFFLEALLEGGAADELPAGVAELVAARVGSLGGRVQGLLEAAAVLGQELDTALLVCVSGWSVDEMLAALDDAAAARLLLPAAGSAGRVAFAHALVREALVQTLPPARGARLHAQAFAALVARAEAGSEEALIAAAGHAIAAAPLVDEEQIATLAEQAAAALSAYAAGDAAHLLELALQTVREPIFVARLQCALGEALQRADRMPEAQAALSRALDAACRLGDGVLRGRAALGVAGAALTILSVDRERVSLLEEALGGLAPDEHELRSRLQSRLAIELAYDRDTSRRERISREAVEAARATGDARATAAALGARHVVLWGPDHTRERLALADEMLASARRANDAALELQARTWRIVDLDELGDGAVLEAELDAYADTAARARLTAYAWWVPAWRSARAYLAGRIHEGEDLRRRAIALGRRAGDRNVDFGRIIHLVIPVADGGPRLAEIDLAWLRERIRTSPAGWAYRSMYVWALAATGHDALARREIASQRAAGDGPSSWPRDTNWLSAAKELSEAAVLLGDLELAFELETLLEPFADRMVVSARALFCLGSVAGALARLAELRGNPGLAIERYTRAIEQEERAGALVWATHDRLRLGQALLAAGDSDGRALLAAVAAEAPVLGLSRVAGEAARATQTRARTGAGR